MSRPARLGAIGDIHAEDARLATTLAFFAGAGVDAILGVGDIVDGKGDPNRCCHLLARAGALAVRGNHDRWFLGGGASLPDATAPEELDADARAYLAGLPPTRVVDTAAGPLLLCHGLDDDDMNGIKPYDEGYALDVNFRLWRLVGEARYRFVVNGHTHLRMVRRFDGLTVINAGTLCRERQSGFVIVDVAARRVEAYDLAADDRIVAAEVTALEA